MRKASKRLVADITETLCDADCSLLFVNQDKVLDGFADGHFSASEKALEVATDKEESLWVPVLAHEFAHFNQWAEGKYNDADKVTNRFFSAVDSFRYDGLTKDRCFLQSIEQDADKRGLQILEEYGWIENDRERDNFIFSSNMQICLLAWIDKYLKHPMVELTLESYKALKESFESGFLPEELVNNPPEEFWNYVKP